MPSLTDTVYPRFKPNLTTAELEQIYTPTPAEKDFAWTRTSDGVQFLRLLVWLKSFQRLGYFPDFEEIPAGIIAHIARCVGTDHVSNRLGNYDRCSVKWHHQPIDR